MKIRYIDKKLTKEDIEAMTGKKVKRIIRGVLDTADPEVKEKGVEIEFDKSPTVAVLTGLDKQFTGLTRK